MTSPIISNVSDTARWVAVYRAWESARPDALFRDPFAERLAGERGRQIASSVPRPRSTRNGWPMITRTKLMDDLVLASVRDGCDCVLNLAAGFDTRPYRLELPTSLTWIEADLPPLIEEKDRALAGEAPACRLRRVPVDLADEKARSSLFDIAENAGSNVLVITEGLLIYLDDAAVRTLSLDLLARDHFSWWVLDFASPAILTMIKGSMGVNLVNAPMKFGPPNGVAFFEELGWALRDLKSLLREGARLKRVPLLLRPFALLSRPDPRNPGNKPWSAVARLERRQGDLLHSRS